MAVHAHPDDESSGTGGLLRLAAEQGHTTVLVTCTNGDLGDVKDPRLRLKPREHPADRPPFPLPAGLDASKRRADRPTRKPIGRPGTTDGPRVGR